MEDNEKLNFGHLNKTEEGNPVYVNESANQPTTPKERAKQYVEMRRQEALHYGGAAMAQINDILMNLLKDTTTPEKAEADADRIFNSFRNTSQ